MPAPLVHQPDPRLDLVLERVVDVPAEFLWRGWTVPEQLKKWFTPAPWKTVDCEIDLRPGGKFRTIMRGPEGQEFDNNGCYLEAVENQRLVFTSSLTQGFRPNAASFPLHFTAIIQIEPKGSGSVYKAIVVHGTPEAAKRHGEMGFN